MIILFKKLIKKLRVFKRIRELESKIVLFREENNLIKDILMKKRHIISDLSQNLTKTVNDLNLIAEKKERASKHIEKLVKSNKELERRRDEFIKRLKSKVPDEVIGGRFENYKYWLAESFIVEDYKSYNGVNENETFVDQFAVYRELDKVLSDKVVSDEKKGKE